LGASAAAGLEDVVPEQPATSPAAVNATASRADRRKELLIFPPL